MSESALNLWIATTNKGKLEEFKQLLAGLPLQFHTLAELPNYAPPKETGKTFLENARLKARSIKAVKPGTWVVAEDSGLEVDGLGGLPGIHSARYAGEKCSDLENWTKLLKMMSLRSADNRKARFRCTLVAFSPDGQEHVFEGVLEGEVARQAKGTAGFGYDPVFVPTGQTQTLAELGVAFKNQNSHRAQAIKNFKAVLNR